MRTTLDIDPDILAAAKEIAERERSTAGAVISNLARKALAAPASRKGRSRNGIPLLPAKGQLVTLKHVERLMDEEGI